MNPGTEERLLSAQSCGLVRDGYAMTLVRLADVKTCVEQIQWWREEATALREKNQELRDSCDRLLAEINGYQNRIEEARTALR